jgi:hypothetical protein
LGEGEKVGDVVRWTAIALRVVGLLWAAGGCIGLVAGVTEKSPVEFCLGILSVVVGIGLLLLRKWAWYLAIVQGGFNLAFSFVALSFLPIVYDLPADVPMSFRHTIVLIAVVTVAFQLLCLALLLFRQTRALFGICSPTKTS